jgi:hypothetical protein
MRLKRWFPLLTAAFLLTPVSPLTADPFHNIRTIGSTVPSNGDVNPYGIAIVPFSKDALNAGSILISNFNNQANQQGTGATIVEIDSSGHLKVFATITAASLPGACPGGVGLTTALAILGSGYVIVGSLPTVDGTAATSSAGCLIVLDSKGAPVETLSGDGINGPWDMTSLDLNSGAVLFVSNVLNGTVAAGGGTVTQGSVLRIVLSGSAGSVPQEVSRTTIASAFPERTDPDALVIGPTGLALANNGILFVADTLGNRIAAIQNAVLRTDDAGAGMTVASGGALNGPLGMALGPAGDILTVNSGDGNIVETTQSGVQRAVQTIDVSGQGAGTLFGLAVSSGHNVFFVDDGNNTLNEAH